jgi:1-deoxy-D-xylulose-5-phosphate synthase
MVVMAPADENECRQMLYTGFKHHGPAAVRYPRGKGPGVEINEEMTELPIGKADIKRRGKGVAILAFGSMVMPALEVGEIFNATVVNMRFVKPLDEALVMEMAKTHDSLVTVEENVIPGGAGAAVSEYLGAQQCLMPILTLGLPDAFVEQGSREECLAACGLDVAGINTSIQAFLDRQHAAAHQSARHTKAKGKH